MKNPLLLGALLLVGAAAAGCGSKHAETDTIQVIPKPVVVVQQPQRQTMTNIVEIPADVEAWQSAKLFSKVAGYMVDIKVDKGDQVVKGELLATVDSPETAQEAVAAEESSNASQASISETQAELSKAQSQVDQMEAEVQAARASQGQAQAAVQRAKADLNLAQTTYSRIKSVYDRDHGLIARQDVDVAAGGLNDAEARLLAARQNLIAAGEGILEAETRKTGAERMVLALQAQTQRDTFTAQASQEAAKRARTLLSYTEIRAPFSGQITARYLDPGALVQDSARNSQDSATPVVSIADFHVVRVYVQVPESDLANLHRHTMATLTADEIPGRTFHGSVTRMSGKLDLDTRSMLTEIDLPNRDHALKPGMLVHMSLSFGTHPHVLTVPLTSLSGDGDTRQLYVVTDNIAHRRKVTLGYQTPDRAEITSGLKGDEWVIVTGKENVQDGVPVEVQSPNSQSPTTGSVMDP